MNAMSTLAGAMGKKADSAKFQAQAKATAAAIRATMMDNTTGLFTDTLTTAGNVHSAWHSQVCTQIFKQYDQFFMIVSGVGICIVGWCGPAKFIHRHYKVLAR